MNSKNSTGGLHTFNIFVQLSYFSEQTYLMGPLIIFVRSIVYSTSSLFLMTPIQNDSKVTPILKCSNIIINLALKSFIFYEVQTKQNQCFFELGHKSVIGLFCTKRPKTNVTERCTCSHIVPFHAL